MPGRHQDQNQGHFRELRRMGGNDLGCLPWQLWKKSLLHCLISLQCCLRTNVMGHQGDKNLDTKEHSLSWPHFLMTKRSCLNSRMDGCMRLHYPHGSLTLYVTVILTLTDLGQHLNHLWDDGYFWYIRMVLFAYLAIVDKADRRQRC